MASGFCLEINSKANGKIKGGSKSKACPDQIEVGGWSWKGVVGDHSAGKSNANSVVVHDVHFTCPMSIASAALFHAAATGDFIKTATLSGRTEGKDSEEIIYMQFRFNEAYITQYLVDGHGADHPVDSFTIEFAGIEILYRQQKPDGSVGLVRTMAYDSSTNTMVKPTLGS